ncbi:MAG TPA: AroM family protein [Candidatus Limnocylindria bacterium]|nr:AroM family protein [Candidatus Limnocylindria bacterium]
MSGPRVGAVTIGQTPRPDLLEPLLARIGTEAEVIEAGALDGLTRDELPSRRSLSGPDAHGVYPLTTWLRDGSSVTLDEADLAPLVQAAIARAEDAGAALTLLLCAGGFHDATARRTLLRPFDAAVARLRALGLRRIGVIVPYEGQVEAARRKWQAAGFDATLLVGDPASLALSADGDAVDALVLDYVGHASRVIDALQGRTALPVVDLGQAGADAVAAVIADQLGRPTVAAR